MSALRNDDHDFELVTSRQEIESHLKVGQDIKILALLLKNREQDEYLGMLSTLMKRLVKEFEQGVAKHQNEAFERIIESYVEAYGDQVPLSSRARRRADMIGNARRDVLVGADWLTAQEVADFAGITGTNPTSQVSKWKRANKIFSIAHHGREYYPDYALEDDFRPTPGLKPILERFKNKSDWGIAYWFASANSYLDGHRPQDLLKSEPGKVLEAASHEMEPVAHV